MSKRLQVLLDENEYKQIQQLAERNHLSVAEWVRRALRAAQAGEPGKERGKKLEAVRTSIKFSYPTDDIQQMIADIESGYEE